MPQSLIIPPLQDTYGTTAIDDSVKAISLIPEQIVGLIPVDLLESDCRGGICFDIKSIDGDKNSFLFEFPIDTPGSDDYRIEKLGSDGETWSEIITGNPNNTLGSESGTKFTFGTYPDFPRYSGFTVDWQLVTAIHGYGSYRFKVVSINDTIYSPCISTAPNICEQKDRTFYVELQNTGQYENVFFTRDNDKKRSYDLRNVTWEDSCRYTGRLDADEIETTESYVLLEDYSSRLHQTTDRPGYTLKMESITLELFYRLFMYGMRGVEIKITDGNNDAMYYFDQLNVVTTGDVSLGEKFKANKLLINTEIKLRNEYDKGQSQC